MSFFPRLWLAISALFRIVFSSAFATRVAALDVAGSIGAQQPAEQASQVKDASTPKGATQPEGRSDESALSLLAILQREGRLIDFLEQEIVAFSDADVGTAARVVHAGCRRALRQHFTLTPLRSEAEGQRVQLETDFDAQSVKLVGDVKGSGPFNGVVRHPGWRATEVRLPTRIGASDALILAPAEIEV